MACNFIYVILIISIITLFTTGTQAEYIPPPENGYPVGYLTECPGILNNVTGTPKLMKHLTVILHENSTSGPKRTSREVSEAHKYVATDKNIDLKNRKTILYAVGFMDSSTYPHSKAIANAYLKKGYNVFVTETFTSLNPVYPRTSSLDVIPFEIRNPYFPFRSVRLARVIGQKLGEFLVKLSELGMAAENLELTGISLGAHIVGYTAKHFYAMTGKKPSRITGLDPAGPCFRAMPPEWRLNKTDGERVDIIHTNIDGFGMADRLGHVDFYVNGGEYQPNDIIMLPCLVVCSHVKSFLYWWQALENPKQFIGLQCNSIQDARMANCFGSNVTNVMGLETDFTKQGIFFLATSNIFPYYRGQKGLEKDMQVVPKFMKLLNTDKLPFLNE